MKVLFVAAAFAAYNLHVDSSNQKIRLQAPRSSKAFWNRNKILEWEPSSAGWPDDAVCCPYVGDWRYWYRKKGMQTSTDDIIVALLAAFPEAIGSFAVPSDEFSDPAAVEFTATNNSTLISGNSHIDVYVDLGCGIGSSLLTVAHAIAPRISVGVEAQEQSAMLLQRTLMELPEGSPDIRVAHKDLRFLLSDGNDEGGVDRTAHADKVAVEKTDTAVRSSPATSHESIHTSSNPEPLTASASLPSLLRGKCDLITANPPYSPFGSGTLCKDPQRRSARFELRGGVEEYMMVARELLRCDDDYYETEGDGEGAEEKGEEIGDNNSNSVENAPSNDNDDDTVKQVHHHYRSQQRASRFILAFWSRDDQRVRNAAENAALKITRRVEVIMGKSGRDNPHLNVYELVPVPRRLCLLQQHRTETQTQTLSPLQSKRVTGLACTLDITRDPTTGGLNTRYEAIRKLLRLAPRPLKT